MSILGAVALTLYPALMAYAAFSDLFTMTISNRLSLLLLGSFVGLALLAGMPLATLLTMHLAAGAAVLVLTFVFFARGWIGGGDAKLAAATAVWLGWENLAAYGLQASVLGFGLTIALVQLRKRELPAGLMSRRWIARLHEAGNGVPYGIALAIAGLSLYPETTVWHAALWA